VEGGPVDAFRVDRRARADSGLAKGAVEIVVVALAIVGRADIERLSGGRDLQHVKAGRVDGLGHRPESDARAGADEAPLLQDLGRHIGRQAVVVDAARVAQS